MSFNKITIVGYLGRDPELRYTPQGTAVCNFSVATTEKRKNARGEQEEHTIWFRVTAWDARPNWPPNTWRRAGRFTSRGGCASNNIPIVTATHAPAPKSTPARYSSWGSALIPRIRTWRGPQTTAGTMRGWRKERDRSPLHPGPTKNRDRSALREKRLSRLRMTKFRFDEPRHSITSPSTRSNSERRSNARSPLT